MGKTKEIKKLQEEMTDEKRVERALVKCADIFEEERLNFSEALAVAGSMIVNAFANKVDECQSELEVNATFEVAEVYLANLLKRVLKGMVGQ